MFRANFARRDEILIDMDFNANINRDMTCYIILNLTLFCTRPGIKSLSEVALFNV